MLRLGPGPWAKGGEALVALERGRHSERLRVRAALCACVISARDGYCRYAESAKSATAGAIFAVVARLNLFTFSRIADATEASSTGTMPVPSTSHRPACAMFHKPTRPLSM